METYFPIPTGQQSTLARQRLIDDLSNLARDAELLLRATAGDLSENAQKAREQLNEGITRAKNTAEQFRQRGIAAAKSADLVIRDHPYESMLTALTIGAVVGFFFTRRNSSSN